MATARITALEEQLKGALARISALESVPAKKPRAKKAQAAAGGSDEEKEPRPLTPWQELLARVRALLKENEEAKTAVGKSVFGFCSHLKGECAGEYDTLTDELILEQALIWVAPAKKPAAEAESEAETAPAPKAKKPAKKPEPAPVPKAKKSAKKSEE